MSERPRAMGLDIGDKRIGIAISDPLGLTAVGFETIERKNNKVDVRVIKAIAERHDVKTIVIGLPKNMNGTIGYQAEKVRDFGVKLARVTGLAVVYEDERLTTVSAIRTLTVQGVRTGENRELVDMQAAAIILQKFLDSESRPPSA